MKKIINFLNVMLVFGKYQIFTKLISLIIIFPIFKFLFQNILNFSGQSILTSGDFNSFIFSPYVILLLLLLILTISFLIALDINFFIILSAALIKKPGNYRLINLLKLSFKSIKKLFCPSGIALIIYISLLLPLIGFGISISPMTDFKVPSFILDAIYSNNLYNSIYLIALIILTVLSFIFIFTLHYAILCDRDIFQSLKLSKKLFFSNFKGIVNNILIKPTIKFLLFLVFFIILIFGLIMLNLMFFRESSLNSRIFLFFSFISASEILFIITLLLIPIFIYLITISFINYNQEEIKINFEQLMIKKKVKTKLNLILRYSSVFVLVIFVNVLMAIIFSLSFDQVFLAKKLPDIVAHRAGGFLDAENSLEGLEKAIAHHFAYSEIDIQRTKDGKYLVNHDNTFKRLAGINKASTDLTLAEAEQIEIKNLFEDDKPNRFVRSLDDYLDAAKDKITLFIELKGKTADFKMVDDLYQIIQKRNIIDQVVLISLDYSLIKYIEEKYPMVKSGYLYYFSFGKLDQLVADYMIIEEQSVNQEIIDYFHQKNKKVVVWTINSEDSIKKFLASDVDALISDNLTELQQQIKQYHQRDDIQIILDSLLTSS